MARGEKYTLVGDMAEYREKGGKEEKIVSFLSWLISGSATCQTVKETKNSEVQNGCKWRDHSFCFFLAE